LRRPVTIPAAALEGDAMPDRPVPDRPTGFTRREVLGGVALGAAALCGAPVGRGAQAAAPAPAPLALPPLPFADAALQPHVSARTLGVHHGRHHRAYVDNLVKLVRGTPLEKLGLDEIVRRTAGRVDQVAVFNNAAQAWNHAFYWRSLAPKGAAPTGRLLERLRLDLGGPTEAKKALVQAGLAQFGSGWVWLVLDGGRLRVVKTGNADTPLTGKAVPLLTVDVWEHAYYLDYQSRRGDYLTAVVDHVLNWDFAARNL
jgi:Fe-Mn family superoxide dismutase